MKINFSIITVTYNSRENLLKTIASIQSQSYKFFAHVIKDGFSNDKTNEINFSEFKNTFFYESKDKGVYDAMNQAFRLSRNEFIIYLNAGDVFFSTHSLKELAILINQNPNYNSYSGGTIQINLQDKIIKRTIGIGKLYKISPLAQLPHPSFVIRRSILSQLDKPFDSNLKIAADYIQQLILRKKGLWKNYYSNQIISIMPTGGISTIDKKSIFFGYRETLISSYKIYNFLSIYLIILKLILNLYSRFAIKYKKNLVTFAELFFQ